MQALRCDCGREFNKGPWAHHDDCELFSEAGFADGDLMWDDEEGCLVPSHTGTMSKQFTDEYVDELLAIEIDQMTLEQRFDWYDILDEWHADEEMAEVEASLADRFDDPVDDVVFFNEPSTTYDWTKDPASKHPRKCECKTICALRCIPEELIRGNVSEGWRRMDTQEYGTWCTAGTSWAADDYSQWFKDRHDGQEVVFPDGTKVIASSHGQRTKTSTNQPDFGVYMASSWNPEWLHLNVPWHDFGLPECEFSWVWWAAETGIALARDGHVVEVGCIGGHGRTGAMLATMGLMCGLETAELAVDWVRKNYCEHAIEGKDQEWWATWAEAYRDGKTLPEPPPKPVYAKVTTTVTATKKWTPPTGKTTIVATSTSPVTKEEVCRVTQDEKFYRLTHADGTCSYEWRKISGKAPLALPAMIS